MKHTMTRHTARYRALKKGFTLIELLVVIVIGLLLTSMAVAQYFPYIDKINYENTVLDIALRMREFQTYGVSTKQDSSQAFTTAYGVHTKVGDSVFTFFQDIKPNPNTSGTVGDGLYNDSSCTPGGECVTQVTMTGYYVASFSVIYTSPTDGSVSQPTNYTDTSNALDITFLRPYLDATIYANSKKTPQDAQGSVNICIADSLQQTANPLRISITRTGQISVRPVTSGTDITKTCT
ncbi:MAG: pilus assembly FimT family protein [Minisyncoccota bacterium]